MVGAEDFREFSGSFMIIRQSICLSDIILRRASGPTFNVAPFLTPIFVWLWFTFSLFYFVIGHFRHFRWNLFVIVAHKDHKDIS